MSDAQEPEGGDAACWLERVCPECGAFVEDEASHRCVGAEASEPDDAERPSS